MRDMIEKIVSTDKKSREALEKVKQLKMESLQKISSIREQKRNEYLKKARENIKISEKEEQQNAEKKIKEIEKEYESASIRIDRLLRDKRDEWVNAIVKRIVEG